MAIITADALAAWSYLIDWKPGGKRTISADVGEIAPLGGFYADGIEAVREALSKSLEIAFDLMSEHEQDYLIGRTLVDWIAQTIIDDDQALLLKVLGIYHAHVVGHGSSQVAFVVGSDGAVKPDTVQLWKHPDMSIAGARETYIKTLDNVWTLLRV